MTRRSMISLTGVVGDKWPLNVTRIVSLGDDTDQFLAIHHEQRPDVILGHFCDRVEDRGVRVNGRNGPILLVEQLQYGYHLGSSQL